MSLLSNWKEKQKQEARRAEAQEKRRQEQELREKASAVRASAEELLFAMDGIRFVSRNGRIPEEKMEKYRTDVDAFRTFLRHAPTLTMDVSEIDGQILKMITLFKQAIENENVQTADRACTMLAYGIKEARAPIHASEAGQEEKILENRSQKLGHMLILMELSGEVESLDDRIERLDRDYEEKKVRYAEAYAHCQKTMKDYPELAQELDEAVVSKKPLSGAASELSTQKKEVIDLYNIMNNIRRVQANMKARQEEYQANIHVLELQLKEVSDLQADRIAQSLKEMQEDFQESMRQSEREIDEMAGVTEQFNKLLDAVFSSQAMIDRILKTDMDYQKLVRREQQIAEGRRLAQEQEEELMQEQAQEQGRLLNQ